MKISRMNITKFISVLCIFLILPNICQAGGSASIVSPVSFVEKNDGYTVKYKKKGTNELHVTYISYNSNQSVEFLTKEAFQEALYFLRKQFSKENEFYLGFWAGAPCA